MPHLSRLELHNLRCFARATLPLHRRVTLILGENGAGKTTIAEALGSFIPGDGLASLPIRRGEREGSISLHEEGADAPIAHWAVEGQRETARVALPRERYLFGYGQYRRADPPAPLPMLGDIPILSGPEAALVDQRRIEDHLSEIADGRRATTLVRPDPLLLSDLGLYILYLNRRRRDDPRIERAWARLNESFRFVHGLDRVEVIVVNDREMPVIVRRGVPLEFRDLSAGYQSVLVVLLDLVLRYVTLFPLLDEPLDGVATVLIDEVDLHLHPRWQRTVVEQLSMLFPKTQFVFTTHSPAVVQGAIDSRALDGDYSVVVLRERKGAAVRVQELSAKELRDLRGAQVSSVLVDERLFDVPSRWALRYERIERKIRKLRAKTEADTATREERERLVGLLDQMQGLLSREEQRLAERPLLSEIAKVQIAFLKRLASKGASGDGSTGAQGEQGPT